MNIGKSPEIFDLNEVTTKYSSLISDQRFTQVLKLETGGELTLNALDHEQFTACIWVKRLTTNAQIELTVPGGWAIGSDGSLLLNETATGQVIPQEQWYCLLLTFAEGRISLFVNGECCGEATLNKRKIKGKLTFTSNTGNVILAQPVLYAATLDASAIQRDYFGSVPTVRKSFTQVQPINFSLINDNGGPFAGYPEGKLFIVDASGEDTVPMQLVLENVGDQPIELQGIGNVEASAAHHHFELRFRNGVILDIKKTLKFARQQEWNISSPIQDTHDHTWSVFFLAKSNLCWKSGESWEFPFHYRTADSAMGERGTHVNLSYQFMELNSGGALTGDRTRQVDILNLSNNNPYITGLNDQLTVTSQRINEMEHKAAIDLKALIDDFSVLQQNSEQEILASRQDIQQHQAGLEKKITQANVTQTSKFQEQIKTVKTQIDKNIRSKYQKLVLIVDQINVRLSKLDDKIGTGNKAANKKFEDLEKGPPLLASVHAPNGIVCGVSNELYIRLENRLNQQLSFNTHVGNDQRRKIKDQIKIKFPIGKDKSQLVSSSTKAGNIKALKASSKASENYAVFEVAVAKIQPGKVREIKIANLIPNDVPGVADVIVEVSNIQGFQPQRLSIPLPKTTRNIAPLAGGGNVGIGVNPEELLHVYGASKTKTSRIRVQNKYGAATFRAKSNKADFGWYTRSDKNAFSLHDYAAKKDVMTMDGAGKVGIGTTTPTERLHVYANTTATQRVMVENKGGSALFRAKSKQADFAWYAPGDSNSFRVYDYDKRTDRMIIDAEGTVTADAFVGRGTAPIGTVIDWFRADSNTAVPKGWRIANGSTISSNDGGAHPSMRGKKLPDLRGKFTRGVSSASKIGETGGSDSHYHRHSLKTDTQGDHNHKWMDNYESSKRIQSYNASGSSSTIIDWGDGIGNGGSGIYPVALQYNWSDFYTRVEGAHEHSVTGSIRESSNVPAYVGMLKLIRVG